jgi:CHRD domain
MLRSLVAAVIVALAVAGLAAGAMRGETYNVTANLKARSEVPKPTGVPTGAVGLFTGKAVELQNDRAKITWKLTFSHLSGQATAAHIHLGKVGKPGPVALALCGPCRSGQKGSGTISHAQFVKMEAGGTYVNIHTAKNAAGEIRGQVKVSEG